MLSGTPSAPGSFGFTAQVSDSAGSVNAQSFSVAIARAGLTIATPSPLLPAAVGSPYSQTLTLAGGSPPYIFSVMSGTLPPGLRLSSAGILSGTPSTAGGFPFTVQVIDSMAQSAAMAYSLTVTGTALALPMASTLPSGVAGSAYSLAITATGGTPPYMYAMTSGSLAPGLSLSNVGFLAGSPSTADTFTFTVQATDNAGTSTAKPFTVTIGGAGSLVLITAALPNGSVGAAFGQSLTVAGGIAP